VAVESSVVSAPRELVLHPRVAQQGFAEEDLQKLLGEVLPRVAPFRGRAVHSVVATLDWDHRLPSKTLTLRLHLCYDEAGRSRFEQAHARRRQEIADRDRFPEFDVPDLAGLPADESYDVELTSTLAVESMRLTSPWRREIAPEDARQAVATVRRSSQFADVQVGDAARSPQLGDLEAVAWTPPCESQQARWTLDVWWLTSFDGRIGRGWSFLVDFVSGDERVAAAREFTIRAG
jgi:hypothetical protein